MRRHIKVCGIASAEEARMVLDAGADALGFNCVVPASPRTISEAKVLDIISEIPLNTQSFLLTTEITADAIASQVYRTKTNVVQILSCIDPQEAERLAKLIPEVRRVQVVHVEDWSALDLIAIYSLHVDAFLLDSGRPSLAVPVLGGTGKTHDWAISAAFVAASPQPTYLAGGLSAANVATAIRQVKPFGVDLASSVRSEGRVDRQKLVDFIATLRDADTAEGNRSGAEA